MLRADFAHGQKRQQLTHGGPLIGICVAFAGVTVSSIARRKGFDHCEALRFRSLREFRPEALRLSAGGSSTAFGVVGVPGKDTGYINCVKHLSLSAFYVSVFSKHNIQPATMEKLGKTKQRGNGF